MSWRAILLVLAAGAAGQDEAKPVRLVRDLTKLPSGRYEIVQSFELKSTETFEQPGEAKQERRHRTWNTFTFDLSVDGEPPVATVTVRRVQLGIEGEETLSYDSDGKAEAQAAPLREQFGDLKGRTATVDLAAFGRGAGFKGLDGAFADYLKRNPDRANWAEANRRNYGDARLDRMFTLGLDVLFGADAGRADGRTRELRPGEAFEVELDESAGFEDKPLKHACKVRSVEKGEAIVEMRWQENALRPTVQEDGGIIMKGGNIECSATMNFRIESGLLVGLAEELKRTDQVSNGVATKTKRSTEKTGFTLRGK
jgi:hypothetical protein